MRPYRPAQRRHMPVEGAGAIPVFGAVSPVGRVLRGPRRGARLFGEVQRQQSEPTVARRQHGLKILARTRVLILRRVNWVREVN